MNAFVSLYMYICACLFYQFPLTYANKNQLKRNKKKETYLHIPSHIIVAYVEGFTHANNFISVLFRFVCGFFSFYFVLVEIFVKTPKLAYIISSSNSTQFSSYIFIYVTREKLFRYVVFTIFSKKNFVLVLFFLV